jgi:hypothetical protein
VRQREELEEPPHVKDLRSCFELEGRERSLREMERRAETLLPSELKHTIKEAF